MDDARQPETLSASLQERLKGLPLFGRELIAGGLAGGLAKTSVAPLERTKILFQTGRVTGNSVFHAVRMLYITEGVPGLFRGNGASVLRIIPYAGIHFSAYEYYRRLVLTILETRFHIDHDRVNPIWDLVAGSTAGATAVLFTYPLDLVRTRLAYATESSIQATGSARHTIRSVLTTTFKREGVFGLYRGMAPTIWGIMPYAGIKFYVYQSLKSYYRHTVVHEAPSESKDSRRLPVPLMLLFGGISGLAGQTATYPLDLVRRRMQVAGLQHASSVPATGAPASAGAAAGAGATGAVASGATTVANTPGVVGATTGTGLAAGAGSGVRGVGTASAGGVLADAAAPQHIRRSTWGTLVAIAQEGGPRALFRGLSINYMKVVPSTAIGFTVYDALKSFLGVKGNL